MSALTPLLIFLGLAGVCYGLVHVAVWAARDFTRQPKSPTRSTAEKSETLKPSD